jgi:TonB family protein
MSEDCRRIRPLLGAYLDHELNPDVARQVKEHLVTCAECRRELESLEHLHLLVHKAGPPEMAEDYWDWQRTRVWRRLRQGGRERQPFYRPSFFWPKLATVAGGLIVVLVVATVGWQMLGPGRYGEKKAIPAERAAPAPGPGYAAKPETPPAKTPAEAPEQNEEPTVEAGGQLLEAPKAGVVAAAGARSDTRADRVGARAMEQKPVPFTGQLRRNERPARPEPEQRRVSIASRRSRTAGRAMAAAVPKEEEPELLSAPPLPKLNLQDSATVVLRLTTDSSGRVTGAVISKSSGVMRLDSIALEAARRSRFKPVRKDHRPVASSFQYPYRFKPGKHVQE